MIKALTNTAAADGRQLDLFAAPPPAPRSAANGYAARPGSRPVGRTCGDCASYCTVRSGTKTYPKCEKVRAKWTHGAGSDIKRSAPACAAFEQKAVAKVAP